MSIGLRDAMKNYFPEGIRVFALLHDSENKRRADFTRLLFGKITSEDRGFGTHHHRRLDGDRWSGRRLRPSAWLRLR